MIRFLDRMWELVLWYMFLLACYIRIGYLTLKERLKRGK